MIYGIDYNSAPLAGRVALKGRRSKVLLEYRMITRAMCDYFGVDTVLKWIAILAPDNMAVGLDIDISPDQGGEYIPEEVKCIE